MPIFIQICLIILVVQNVCSQSDTCNCSNNSTKCIAQNQICIPEQFKNTIQNPHSKPQDIVVELKYLQIIGVNDKLKEITLNVLVIIFWYDYRLQILKENEQIFLEHSDAKQIWMPSLKLVNNLMSVSYYRLRGEEQLMFAIVPENSLTMSRLNYPNYLNGSSNHIQTDRYISGKGKHYKVTLLCDMVFGMFPFDKQECKFEVRQFDFSYLNIHPQI